MSANKPKEMSVSCPTIPSSANQLTLLPLGSTDSSRPSHVSETSKASLTQSTSSKAASTKATSSTNEINLGHHPIEQVHDQTSSHQTRERSRDARLRGIGAWTDSPSQHFGAEVSSDNGGGDQRRSDSGELEINPGSEGSVNQALTPMERFRAEKRNDGPFGYLESSSESSQRSRRQRS